MQRETAGSLGEPFGLGGLWTCQFGKNQLLLVLESEFPDIVTSEVLTAYAKH